MTERTRWYSARDYREIGVQLGALLTHLWAVAHHAQRLAWAIMGRELPRGL